MSDGQGEDMTCPSCKDWLVVTPTAYGESATCRACRIRWTRLYRRHHDGNMGWDKWVAETYIPMGEYTHE